MIDVKLSGDMPTVNTDYTSAMEQIRDIMFASVQQNFITGGRPTQWEPLQPFGLPSHLYQSGAMFDSIQVEHDRNHASVFIDTARMPYAAIHNYGGTIKHPGSKKFQAFQYGDAMVFTYGTKAHDIRIPQRQFMMFQEEDKTAILQILGNAIFIESLPTGGTGYGS